MNLDAVPGSAWLSIDLVLPETRTIHLWQTIMALFLEPLRVGVSFSPLEYA